MSRLIQSLLGDSRLSHLHPFTGLRPSHRYEDLRQTFEAYQAAGIHSMTLLWGSDEGSMRLASYHDEVYWERMRWVVELCHQYHMTFLLQDAAPFPTGAADGWFAQPAHAQLNKRYLAERHMDVVGPRAQAAILVGNMVGAILPGDDSAARQRLPGDRLLSLTALRHGEAGGLTGSPIDLTARVRDGLLHWDIPAGVWRLHAVYETYNGHGRPHYMNLLDPASVALNIEAVGEALFAPYRLALPRAYTGPVRLRIEVQPNRARQMRLQETSLATAMISCTASAYNVLDPGGLLGPVRALYDPRHLVQDSDGR